MSATKRKKKGLTALGQYVFAGGFAFGVSKHFFLLGAYPGSRIGASRNHRPRRSAFNFGGFA